MSDEQAGNRNRQVGVAAPVEQPTISKE
jgi:hypothetical protein